MASSMKLRILDFLGPQHRHEIGIFLEYPRSKVCSLHPYLCGACCPVCCPKQCCPSYTKHAIEDSVELAFQIPTEHSVQNPAKNIVQDRIEYAIEDCVVYDVPFPAM